MYPLFISPDDLVKRTAINGNVDRDQMVQFIKIAQDLHIQALVGTALYNTLKNDVLNNTLTGNYETLMTDYVQDVLVHYAMVEILPFLAYKVSNGGIFKKQSENSEGIDKSELEYLIQKERDTAEHYGRRLVSYLTFYGSLTPEYYENQNGQMYPTDGQSFHGWYL
jgi:hypothetical protein